MTSTSPKKTVAFDRTTVAGDDRFKKYEKTYPYEETRRSFETQRNVAGGGPRTPPADGKRSARTSVHLEKTPKRPVPDGLRFPADTQGPALQGAVVQEPLSPPLDGGFFATLKREYGLRAFWYFFIIAAIAGALATVVSITTAKEIKNGRAALSVLKGFSGLADASTERAATILQNVEFSNAAIDIANIWEGGTKGRVSPLNVEINNFIQKSREVDRAWRYFLSQRVEFLADSAGRMLALEELLRTNPQTRKKDVAQFFKSDISKGPERLLLEAKILLCQLESKKSDVCAPGPGLNEIQDALRTEIGNAIPAFPKTQLFREYNEARKRGVKELKDTISTWDKTLHTIGKAQGSYYENHSMGLAEEVTKEAEVTRKKLEFALTGQKAKMVNVHQRFPDVIKNLVSKYAKYI